MNKIFTNVKSFLFILFLTTTVAHLSAQNVGVNTTGAAPDVSAISDIATTNKSLLISSISLKSKIYATDLDTKTMSDNKSIIISNTQYQEMTDKLIIEENENSQLSINVTTFTNEYNTHDTH